MSFVTSEHVIVRWLVIGTLQVQVLYFLRLLRKTSNINLLMDQCIVKRDNGERNSSSTYNLTLQHMLKNDQTYFKKIFKLCWTICQCYA